MLKTHEKSRFEVLSGTNVRDTKRIVVQIGEEKLYTNPAGMACFLCETVDPEDYNRTTAEGRAAEAEKSLQEEIEAHKIETEEAQAKIDALEELLEKARDTREGMKNAAAAVREENGSSRTDFLLIYKVFSFTVLVMGISKSTKYIFIFQDLDP